MEIVLRDRDSKYTGAAFDDKLEAAGVRVTRSRPNNGRIRIYGGAASNTLSQNVISGNSFQGVGIYNPGSTGNMIQANYIGTNSQATAALPNGADGVVIQEGASGNSVSGNVISGNTLSGVFLQDSNTTGNTISGNKIGTKGDGVTGPANQNFGVRINGAVGNTVGLGQHHSVQRPRRRVRRSRHGERHPRELDRVQRRLGDRPGTRRRHAQ